MNRRMSYIAVACVILTVLAVSCAQDASTEPQTPAVTDDPTQITNKAPAAVASETADLLTGELFTLDGSESSDTDGTVVGWNWDLGDGTSVTGKTAQASYTTAGSFTITLTVTDDDGATAKDTAEVTVREPGTVTVEIN